jgi:serine/threonine protein kinase
VTTTQPKRQPIPFGKYLLLDRINIGGMAEVWRGKMFGAGGFERLVAIKRILPNIAEDDEFISMFIDEAKISVQLTHANVAQIYELGQINSSYFISMEYIPGKDMRAIFDRGRKKGEPAPVPLVAYCVSKMCEGLDYAHRKKDGMGRDMNIVHRDISPQNILISYEGEVKVIDFGIAKAAGKATKTQAGILKGKFGYMSPEQIRGLPLDRRSDVFAIGVCLYEMLTGERLFVGDSDFSVLEKVRKAEVAPPSTYNRRIPDALEKIVLKALARDVDERYQYANELGDDLQRFLLTSDSIFGRKDLMQYMKSTFAEDVEREKQRLQEYVDIKPPEGMLAAIEMGFGGTPSMTQMPAVVPAPSPAPVGRAPTLQALPKLTAAPAAVAKDDENGATMLVDSSEMNAGSEPTTEPNVRSPGRKVTPLGVPAVKVPSGAVPRPPSLAPSPAPPQSQSRPSADGLPRIVRPEPPPDSAHAHPARNTLPPGPAMSSRPPPAMSMPPLQQPIREVMPAMHAHAVPSGPVQPVRSEPPAPTHRLSLPLLAALGGVVVLVLGVLIYLLVASRPAPTGFLMVNLEGLPHDVQAKARVNISGQEVQMPSSGPLLQPVPSGPAAVMVSVEGYETYTQVVDVMAGQQVSKVEVKLQRLTKAVPLVVVTQPGDAEVLLDGKVVRTQGSGGAFLGELDLGSEAVVEVRAPGHKPFVQRVTAKEEKAVNVMAQLEQDTIEVHVDSTPSGAGIYVGSQQLGTTPDVLKLSPSIKQVSLRLHCYTEAAVDVVPGSAGAPAKAVQELQRIPRCK